MASREIGAYFDSSVAMCSDAGFTGPQRVVGIRLPDWVPLCITVSSPSSPSPDSEMTIEVRSFLILGDNKIESARQSTNHTFSKIANKRTLLWQTNGLWFRL